MKARVTTLLSLTGVLVAGSAAALVNTQVLQATTTRKSTATEISVADSESQATSTSVVNKFEQLAPVVLAPAVSTQFAYEVGTAGTVVLDTVGGVLTIVSVTPIEGWTVAESQNSDPLSIEIKLASPATLIEFKASLVAGKIVTSVESTDLTTTSTGSSGSSGPANTVHTSGTTTSSGSTQHTHTTTSTRGTEPKDDHGGTGGGTSGGKGGGGSDD